MFESSKLNQTLFVPSVRNYLLQQILSTFLFSRRILSVTKSFPTEKALSEGVLVTGTAKYVLDNLAIDFKSVFSDQVFIDRNKSEMRSKFDHFCFGSVFFHFGTEPKKTEPKCDRNENRTEKFGTLM